MLNFTGFSSKCSASKSGIVTAWFSPSRSSAKYQVNYGLEQFFYNRLHDLGWFRLARQPARGNYNWVIEFYASNSAGEDHATVRSRRVPTNAATINVMLGLPDNDPSFYVMLEAFEEEDFEQIKDYLCEEGTAWNTTDRNPHSVSRLSLQPEAKLWNTFVKRNIMPTSHNRTVDRMRLLLIHTIMTGFRINVGKILAKKLAAACANDKGILAFPCLISALCRRATVPTSLGDKLQAEKTGWTRATYMRKMDVVDATLLNVAMPTPTASPIHTAATTIDEAGPSAPAAQAEPQYTPVASLSVVPVSSHTTTASPATIPTARPRSRESTLDTPLGSTPISPPSPPTPVQSKEAAPPPHILQLRSQLQRIEARQLQFQEETKAGATEEVHFSSDNENDVFDWQSPRDHLQPIGPTPSKPAMAMPILLVASTPTTSAIAERPTPDSPTRRKGKATAGRSFGRSIPSSPEEKEPEQRPAKRKKRYHVIIADSDDDNSAELPVAQPQKSADPSLSTTF
ncbi:hypothetical protein GQ457_01G021950 [Hibiscus cannabinus]